MGSRSYGLCSEGPEDNRFWGMIRVYLAAGEIVPVGSSKTFTTTFTAPSTPGVYNFQWMMIEDGLAGNFGPMSTPVSVTVT